VNNYRSQHNPRWQGAGLLFSADDSHYVFRKYYYISQDGARAGGIYLWMSREDADRNYTEEWRSFVRAK